MEQEFAPPDDPVFDLVPYTFGVRANAVWADMGSPEPQFSNAWDVYLHIRDALQTMAWDGAFRECLSAASQSAEHYSEVDYGQGEDERLADLSDDEGDVPIVDRTDTDESEDELLVVDLSDDEGGTLIVDLTDVEEDENSIEHDF